MRGLAGAVIALHHDATVMGKAGQNSEGGISVKAVVRISIGHMLGTIAKGGHHQVLINCEYLAHTHLCIRSHERVKSRSFVVRHCYSYLLINKPIL